MDEQKNPTSNPENESVPVVSTPSSSIKRRHLTADSSVFMLFIAAWISTADASWRSNALILALLFTGIFACREVIDEIHEAVLVGKFYELLNGSFFVSSILLVALIFFVLGLTVYSRGLVFGINFFVILTIGGLWLLLPIIFHLLARIEKRV